jgi:hypothetical protein
MKKIYIRYWHKGEIGIDFENLLINNGISFDVVFLKENIFWFKDIEISEEDFNFILLVKRDFIFCKKTIDYTYYEVLRRGVPWQEMAVIR